MGSASNSHGFFAYSYARRRFAPAAHRDSDSPGVLGVGDLAGCPLNDLSPLYANLIQSIVQHIAHELRLQFLGAKFSANVQRSFALGQFLAPTSKIEDGRPVLFDRGPHDPPAVAGCL